MEVAVQEVLANLYFLLGNYGLWSDIPYRIGASNFMPPNGYYPCQDGYVFIAALMPRLWERLVEVVGDPRLADAALRDAEYRNDHPEFVDPMYHRCAMAGPGDSYGGGGSGQGCQSGHCGRALGAS